MGIFSNNKNEMQELRGVTDEQVRKSDNLQLIMTALAVLLEANQIEDEVLISELKARANYSNTKMQNIG